MSLDVYLIADEPITRPRGSGIFIREAGSTKEISREEWDRRNPGRKPFVLRREGGDGPNEVTTKVYQDNITHNLNAMAEAASLYLYLWRPEEIDVTKAGQLIEPLTAGLAALCADPEKFKALNPPSGWGNYEGLVGFVERYLEACKQYPSATIQVSR